MPDPFDLNLRHLRALDAIVTKGSMSAAAATVSLSQPALTQGLAKLEAQIGQPLFRRRSNGMDATDAGRALAERAARAADHLAVACRSLTRAVGRGFARPDQLITATQARAILNLAAAGSFAGAGQRSGLSQPAVHRAVRDLEQLCSVPLLERRGRGVVLTAAGQRLVRGIRLAALELAAGLVEAAPDDGPAGRLTIGAMPLCRARVLPSAIARFAQEAPGIVIEVVEGSWRELVDPLREGTIDLMIGALRASADVPDLVQDRLFDDRLAVVARTNHPLARAESPSLDRLSAFPWIIGQAGTPLRAHWEALFAGRALPPHPIECGSVMTIRGILRESDCLTLLSPDQITLEEESGLLCRIGPPLDACVRTIGLTTRADWRPTRWQRRFTEIVRLVSAPGILQESE